MPIIAPIPLRIGHGPISHCSRDYHASTPRSCRSRIIVTHDSADAAAAATTSHSSCSLKACNTTQQQPEQLDTMIPTQLSFRGLLQSENVQAIQENLIILARFANHLPLDFNTSTSSVDNDELVIMGRLVRDIGSSLDKIGSLRDDDTETLPNVAEQYVPVRSLSLMAKRRRREKMKTNMAHKCHNCHRLETPQWRPGPDGPKTLCNVCGLIYTKRQQRHAEQATRASARSSISCDE